jgi:hypothetical protein
MKKHVSLTTLRGEALNAAIRSILWPNGHPTDVGRPQIKLPHFRGITYGLDRPYGPLPRDLLPYGWWYLQDRSEVCFSRGYMPMYRVFLDGRVERADPNQFYEYFIQCWFYEDRCNPFDKGKENKRRKEILQAVVDDLAERCEPVALWEEWSR